MWQTEQGRRTCPASGVRSDQHADENGCIVFYLHSNNNMGITYFENVGKEA